VLDHDIALNLTLGTHDPRTAEALTRAGKSYSQAPVGRGMSKMHNKIWVIDKEGVILGSPNVSFAGLQGKNLESFILIKSPRVGHFFTRYLEMVRSGQRNSPLAIELGKELVKYNAESHKLKLAMAPVLSITDFVAENLAGATKIVIRQFLISPAAGGQRDTSSDILAVLCGMARDGTDIEVYIDDAAYDKMAFVRRAASDLISAGCKVFTQTPVLVVNADNEGIQHDKLILATLHGGVRRTMIGSAGFTDHVIANTNWENFICTDVEGVYESLMAHHQATLGPGTARTLRVEA
jgi:phosphatidylserine/phosphatidylglycerophosphate/cardiolipin synthase-like enzyme